MIQHNMISYNMTILYNMHRCRNITIFKYLYGILSKWISSCDVKWYLGLSTEAANEISLDSSDTSSWMKNTFEIPVKGNV